MKVAKSKQETNKEYWQKRSEDRLINAEKKALAQERNLIDVLDRCQKDLEGQIVRIYNKFAKDNNMDYSKAVKYLTDNERAEFQKDLNYYLAQMKNPDTRDDYRKELHALSVRARVQRIEAMKAEIRVQADKLYSNLENQGKEHLRGTYTDTFNRTMFDTQQFTHVGARFDQPSERTLNAILEHPWSGKNFSAKVWDLSDKFVNKLDTALTQGLVQGKSVQAICKDLKDVNFGAHGKKEGGNAYEIKRLVRTETNYIANRATLDAYNESRRKQYQYLATLDNRTSEICAELDGKVFDVKDGVQGLNMPPMHPFCRSTTIPYFAPDEIDEEFGTDTRIARGDNGKNYNVPADMTYNEWKKKYVDKNSGNDIIGGERNIPPRNMANGLRTQPSHILTKTEIQSLKKDIKAIGADESVFRFNEGYYTGYVDKINIIRVRGDVLPDLSSEHPRDRMSTRAVLAHEYYGHRPYRGTKLLPGSWNDEFRASYMAAKNAPNLSDDDRRHLIIDAIERAKENGVSIKYNETIRRILHGY